MKSAILSAVAAFHCLGCGNAQLRGPAADLEFPSYRFVLWNDLTDALRLSAVGLEYTQATWQIPLDNAIESSRWDSLGEVNQFHAAAMGFDEAVWDCYQNHYDGYEWSELVDIGVVQYFEALGWDENCWNGLLDPPLAIDELQPGCRYGTLLFPPGGALGRTTFPALGPAPARDCFDQHANWATT